MPQRSWQRDLMVTQTIRERCAHGDTTFVRTIGGDNALDDHRTDVVYCPVCDQYLTATSYRSREDMDYTPLSPELDAAERRAASARRKAEQRETAKRLHDPLFHIRRVG